MKRADYSKRMLRKQDCIKFRGCIGWQFFWKPLCWFLRCSAGKKEIKISSGRWWRFQLATTPILSVQNIGDPVCISDSSARLTFW